MVARQTLTLFVWVQILVPQPCRGKVRFAPTFFYFDAEKISLHRVLPAPAPSNVPTAENLSESCNGLLRLAVPAGGNRCAQYNQMQG